MDFAIVSNRTNTHSWLGWIAEQQGNLPEALAYREESLAIKEKIKAPDSE